MEETDGRIRRFFLSQKLCELSQKITPLERVCDTLTPRKSLFFNDRLPQIHFRTSQNPIDERVPWTTEK
jgi:hypothetical protein